MSYCLPEHSSSRSDDSFSRADRPCDRNQCYSDSECDISCDREDHHCCCQQSCNTDCDSDRACNRYSRPVVTPVSPGFSNNFLTGNGFPFTGSFPFNPENLFQTASAPNLTQLEASAFQNTGFFPNSFNQFPFFFAITTSVSLSASCTPLQFIPRFQTPGITGASPRIIFNTTGTFLLQIRLPLTTFSSTRQSRFFISSRTLGNITVSPCEYVTTPLTPNLNNAHLVFYFLVIVHVSGASVLFNVSLNSTAQNNSALLGAGFISASMLS